MRLTEKEFKEKILREMKQEVLNTFNRVANSPNKDYGEYRKLNYPNNIMVEDNDRNDLCYFTIDGVSGWRFGMILHMPTIERLFDIDGYQHGLVEISMYAQHVLNIDKFKPSTSNFKTVSYPEVSVKCDSDGMIIDYNTNPSQELLYDIIKEFRAIFNNKHVAFWIDSKGSLKYEYVTRTKAFLYYIKRRIQHNIEIFQDKRRYKKYMKIVKKYFTGMGIRYEITPDKYEGPMEYEIIIEVPRDIQDWYLRKLQVEWSGYIRKIEGPRFYSGFRLSEYIIFEYEEDTE